MGATKNDVFSLGQNQVSIIAKALAQPARIAILDFIIQNPFAEVKSLELNLKICQATISQHLGIMVQCGLLIKHSESNRFYYTINDNSICLLEAYFYELNQVILRDRYFSLPI